MSYPAKPADLAPCNGCGVCCVSSLCPLAIGVLYSPDMIEVLGDAARHIPGPCPILEWEHGRAWCGLVRNPERYVRLVPTGQAYDSLAKWAADTRELLGDGSCDCNAPLGVTASDIARRDHPQTLQL
jgi:hypothetical protein